MNLAIELEQETDERWIAEIDVLNGVLVYGETSEDAIRKVKTLAFRVMPTAWKTAKCFRSLKATNIIA